MIDVTHCRQQWPVGHGFFHTASVQFDDDIYRYVYDCGAIKLKTIKSQIDRYASNEAMENRRNPIDILVISHFHNDHINGLPHFLSLFKVKKMVIPYLADNEKIVGLAGLAANSVTAWTELSGLLIEPREWLRVRDSDAELIEVANASGDGDQGDNNPEPPPGGTGLSLGAGNISHHKHGSIFWKTEPLWDLKFYVQDSWEVCTLVYMGLIDRFKPASETEMKEWLSDPAWITANHIALKKVFMELGSGKQNSTNLCMYSGIGGVGDRYRARYSSASHGCCHPYHWHRNRLGWLGTGDAELKSNDNIEAFKSHYSGYLESVDTLTIPHHGSIGNYCSRLGDIGLRHVITADYAEDPKGHHPSREVILNLQTKSDYTHIATLDESSTLFHRIRGYRIC